MFENHSAAAGMTGVGGISVTQASGDASLGYKI